MDGQMKSSVHTCLKEMVNDQNGQTVGVRKPKVVSCLKAQPLKSTSYGLEASNTSVKASALRSPEAKISGTHCSENISQLMKVDEPFTGPIVEINDAEDSEVNKPVCFLFSTGSSKVNSTIASKEFKASHLCRKPSIPENQSGSSLKDKGSEKLSTLISERPASEVVDYDEDVPLSQVMKKLGAPDKKAPAIKEVTGVAFSPRVRRIKKSRYSMSLTVPPGFGRPKRTRLIHNVVAFPHPNNNKTAKKRKMNTEGIETVNCTNSQKEDNKSDELNDLSDPVCEICDDGGSLVCCEGKCMRSFHPTVRDGAEYHCASLGYTEAEVEELNTKDFYCDNCKYEQHQCFVCGELGSSDESSGAEVFRCGNGSCGRFYHPVCVVKLLHPGDKTEAEKDQKKIAAGKPFTCSLHKCHVCGKREVKYEHDLQFAICRRCPKAYHRKCLPTEIAYEKDEAKGIFQRAWNYLLPNRVLIYCLDHEIDRSLSTPIRNHIKFPVADVRKKTLPLSSIYKKKVVLKEIGAGRDKKLPGSNSRDCNNIREVDNKGVNVNSQPRLRFSSSSEREVPIPCGPNELNQTRLNSTPVTRPGFQGNLFGLTFAPGPYRPPPPGCSNGWLDE